MEVQSDSKHSPQIRRVVTRDNDKGKSCIWLDDYLSNHKFLEDLTSSSVWATCCTPAHFLDAEDMGERILGTSPPVNGTRFCVVEIKPGTTLNGHRTDSLDYVICLSGEITLLLDEAETILKPGEILIQRGTTHAWANRGHVAARLACILIDGVPKRTGSLSGYDQADSSE